MNHIRLFAAVVLLACADTASADVAPFRHPNQPPEDVPPHAPPRPQPKSQPATCGTGAGLSLAGIAAVWGLTWGSSRLRRLAKTANLPIRR